MNIIFKISFVFLMLVSFQSYAQQGFVENKGQFPAQVQYKISTALHQIYFEKDRFTFNLIDGEDYYGSSAHHGLTTPKRKRNKIKGHAYQMHFVNANKNVRLSGSKESSFSSNYLVGNKKNWARNVKSYSKIKYQSLYRNIDLKVCQKENGIKYDFVVKPGGKIDNIKMEYEGIDKISIHRGNLKIVTSIGKIIESKPFAYQLINGEKKEINSEYQINKQKISIHLLAKYDPNIDLIIDPELVFSTYSGSTTDNWGFTACSDKLGNVYSAGIAFGTGYPVTLGAYQIDFESDNTMYPILDCNITISKYNPAGTNLLWATYLGGIMGEEIPHSLVVNEFNELIIFGTTGSYDFPVSSNAYNPNFQGGSNVTYDGQIHFRNGTDIFVSKLSADGTQLTGSTFIGGSKNDGINWRSYYTPYTMEGNDSLYYNYGDGARGEVICDLNSNIYVGSTTFSNDFPIVNGFQSTAINNLQDGVIFKLSSDLSNLEWSSYLGGSHDDAVYSIDINNLGEVYAAGGTVSNEFPTTPNAYQTSFQGGTADGFVTHISSDGSQLLASSYFGSPMYDQAFFVRCDKYNNVYITGQTEATDNTLIHNAAYNDPNSGQFIAKFLPGLEAIEWSTTFGTGNGKPNISISAFAVDVCNRIYLSGWGREWGSTLSSSDSYWEDTFGTKGMHTTPNAIQTETDGQDFYIMVMYGDASAINYATFFGEIHTGDGYCGHDHVDGGTSRFDRLGNIYQSTCASCGFTGSPPNTSCNNFPTTTGAAFENNGGATNSSWVCNNAVFRLSFTENITISDFYAPPFICENTEIEFSNTGSGTSYYWDFGDGSATSNEQNPSHLFLNTGTYNVTLISIDSNSCNIADTITKEITVQEQSSTIFKSDTICLGNLLEIGVITEPNTTYTWFPNSGLSDPNLSNPLASPQLNTTYTLTINDGVCSDTLKQHIEVLNIEYIIDGIKDTIICHGSEVTLNVFSTKPIKTYIWSTDNNFTNIITESSDPELIISPEFSNTYYIKTLDSICQVEKIDSVKIKVDQATIKIKGETTVCKDSESSIYGEIEGYPSDTIFWTPNSKIVSGQGTNQVSISKSNSFWLFAERVTQNGCIGKDSVFINIDDISASYTKENILCYGKHTGSIQLSYNGFEPFVFDWNNDSISNTDNPTNLYAGIYQVNITDSLGCSETIEIMLEETSEINIEIDSLANTGCGENWMDGYANVSVSGGTPGYNYRWTDPSGYFTYSTDSFAENLHCGSYICIVSDQNDCWKSILIKIYDSSSLETSTLVDSVSCHNFCDGSISVSITTPSVPDYTYTWSSSEETIPEITTSINSIDSLCSGHYTVTISDANNCKRVHYTTLYNPTKLVGELTIPKLICYGDTVSAHIYAKGGTGNYSYQWSAGSDSSYQQNLIAGNYSLTISDINNCIYTDSFSIINPPKLLFDSLITGANCYKACNGSAEIIAKGGIPPYQYLWDNEDTTQSTDLLCFGKHWVKITDHNLCHKTLDINIPINTMAVTVNASANPPEIYRGESSFLSGIIDTSCSYFWTPENSLNHNNITNPIATPNKTTIYILNIEDQFGCTNFDTTMVTVRDVICREPYVFIPNAFSPNGDGHNDVLYVRGEMIVDFQLSIFNRWGELVFETKHINQGWDGTYLGKPVDPGVFVYYFTATCINQETFKKKGNITLIK